MSRERQRANRALKQHAQSHAGKLPEGASSDGGATEKSKPAPDKPWRNDEGYNDPTAYQAIRNLELAARRAKRLV